LTVLRTGIDLVEVERLVELKIEIRQKFLERIFTVFELGDTGQSNELLASRFAAKEAVAKALGCGIGPVSWGEIEVRRDDQGDPILKLTGNAQKLAEEAGLTDWSLSLSHTAVYAVALVVGYGETELVD
jgi:holo-[acyl-carrier protein] synthase